MFDVIKNNLNFNSLFIRLILFLFNIHGSNFKVSFYFYINILLHLYMINIYITFIYKYIHITHITYLYNCIVVVTWFYSLVWPFINGSHHFYSFNRKYINYDKEFFGHFKSKQKINIFQLILRFCNISAFQSNYFFLSGSDSNQIMRKL